MMSPELDTAVFARARACARARPDSSRPLTPWTMFTSSPTSLSGTLIRATGCGHVLERKIPALAMQAWFARTRSRGCFVISPLIT